LSPNSTPSISAEELQVARELSALALCARLPNATTRLSSLASPKPTTARLMLRNSRRSVPIPGGSHNEPAPLSHQVSGRWPRSPGLPVVGPAHSSANDVRSGSAIKAFRKKLLGSGAVGPGWPLASKGDLDPSWREILHAPDQKAEFGALNLLATDWSSPCRGGAGRGSPWHRRTAASARRILPLARSDSRRARKHCTVVMLDDWPRRGPTHGDRAPLREGSRSSATHSGFSWIGVRHHVVEDGARSRSGAIPRRKGWRGVVR